MKSRTLIWLPQRPTLNPSHCGTRSLSSCRAVVAIVNSPLFDRSSSRRPGESEQSSRVARDHQLFVCWNYKYRYLAVRSGDLWSTFLVGRLIEFDTEPHGRLADPLTNLGGVLSNAGGEHEPVDSTKHRRERADLFCNAIDKVIHCETSIGLGAAQEIAHVVADT